MIYRSEAEQGADRDKSVCIDDHYKRLNGMYSVTSGKTDSNNPHRLRGLGFDSIAYSLNPANNAFLTGKPGTAREMIWTDVQTRLNNLKEAIQYKAARTQVLANSQRRGSCNLTVPESTLEELTTPLQVAGLALDLERLWTETEKDKASYVAQA